MADFLICMGSSVSSAGGIARATNKKVISFIGDSTFFHSGITGLINAAHNKHNFTLVILDNGTTAMTGQQPHPGVDLVPPGWDKPTISIEGIVEACGVDYVATIDPRQLSESKGRVTDILQSDGLSVIVSRAPCPLIVLVTQTKGRATKIFNTMLAGFTLDAYTVARLFLAACHPRFVKWAWGSRDDD